MELQTIQSKIYEIRGQRVMLDFDLAELYQVETRALKQAVRRNIERFPEDFMFEITETEYNSLKNQLEITNCDLKRKRRPPLYAICLYRTRGGNAFEHLTQRNGHTSKYRHYAGIRGDAQLHHHNHTDNGRIGRN